MGTFSFNRAVQYARYNCVVQAKTYMWNWFSMFAIPLFFAVLSRDVHTASGMAMIFYLVAAITFPAREMTLLRGRGTKVMAMTLPVSNVERYLFMLFGVVVTLPLVSLLTSVLAMVAAAPFHFGDLDLGQALATHIEESYLSWGVYLLVQLFASLSLLIVIMARRSLIWAYAVAVVGLIVLMNIIGSVSAYEGAQIELWIEENNRLVSVLLTTIFSLIPVVLYALGYVALCRRQVRW